MNDLPWASSDRGQIALSLSALHRAAARTANVSTPRRAVFATEFCWRNGGFGGARRACEAAGGSEGSAEELDHAIPRVISKAVAAEEIVDIFSAAA